MSDQLPPPPPPPPPPFPLSIPPSGETGRTGPPWEGPGPVFGRFLETVRGVLLDPTAFFRSMRQTGGLGAPLTFGIAGTLLGSLIGSLWQLMFLSGDMFPHPDAAGDAAAAALVSSGCVVVFVPIGAVLGMFIGAAIYHVMLLLLGAARQPFETTMRVVAYSMGSTSLLHILPVCGAFIATVWAIVAYIIGLAQAHEISTGKAAAAVLIPVAVCCVIFALFYAAVAAVFLGALAGGFEG